MWRYELHPPYLINVATPPCESRSTENVILQLNITKEHYTRCIIASSKWTRVTMCLKFAYFGCYTTMCVWNKDSWHRRPAKTLDANLVWRCDWPVAWPSEIMCACWWWTLWSLITAVTRMFIYMTFLLPEHFMKLSMFNGYFVVNIKSWSCVHVHFRCFDFHKVV